MPVTVCVILFLLLFPRATRPDAVPVPAVDERAIREAAAHDRDLAAHARTERLPSDVLAVGSALRALHARDARDASGDGSADVAPEETHALYQTLAFAVSSVLSRPDGARDLVALRAVQVETFLVELARSEAEGAPSPELVALAGAFMARMRDAGWADERHVRLDEDERRIVFKSTWNALVRTNAPELQPSLDEQRVLYRLYLTRPHPPSPKRREIEAERSAVRTEADCERVRADEARATELWRADKIKRLGALDPSYPTMYALGVAYSRAGERDLALTAFRKALDEHPEGPFALRARNHLAMAVKDEQGR